MQAMKVNKIENSDVAEVFSDYPQPMRKKLIFLRKLVWETALETDGVTNLEETLKWGEPSYVAKGGTAIRMDWKKTKPNQYALYFHCQTKLVDTFKEFYKDKFKFEGNRAIVFDANCMSSKECVPK
jgi:hypothetical protein